MTLLDERQAFCTKYPGEHVPPGDIPYLLSLAGGPESVLELSDGEGRGVLAMLLESCENAADAAEIVLLGRRPGAATDAWAEATLAWGMAKARHGPRANLHVPGPEQGFFSKELLQRAGFTEAFRTHDMERPPAPPPELPELPPGLRMADLQPEWIPSLYETTVRAFATVPGANVPPLSDFAPRMLSRPIPPRVVLQGERAVGFVRVELDADGTGRIQMLGRHPDVRGTGLGPRLLAEGLHLLSARGAGRIGLEVAAENERALALYQRAGFEVVRSCSTWQRHST